jgi:hypothetical protein
MHVWLMHVWLIDAARFGHWAREGQRQRKRRGQIALMLFRRWQAAELAWWRRQKIVWQRRRRRIVPAVKDDVGTVDDLHLVLRRWR